MTRTLSVWVGVEIIYLYGTVNGVAATFTLVGTGEWQTIVPRADDDNYILHLEAYSVNGLEGTYDYTLYYGMMPCVTDRTAADVRNKTSKGFYNATDLNRVGHNVGYLANLLYEHGYTIAVSPKANWQMRDIPRIADMAVYLADVEALKSALSGTTPLPDTMDDLTVEAANNIEQLLCEIERNITNMTAAWHYSGELYSGEV